MCTGKSLVKSQEVGGTLIREDWLVLKGGGRISGMVSNTWFPWFPCV
jgi:hypothetical protein